MKQDPVSKELTVQQGESNYQFLKKLKVELSF